MFSTLPLNDQLRQLSGSFIPAALDREGDLRIVKASFAGRTCLVIAFDYSRQMGSIGGREADQIIAALGMAKRDKFPVVLLMNSSGVRVTEGNEGVAALRRSLRAAIDARLDGVRMLALVGRGCFGGASVLAATCEHIVVNPTTLFSMSGPKLIERLSGKADLDASDPTAVRSLLGGEARSAASDAFILAGNDGSSYAQQVTVWMAAIRDGQPALLPSASRLELLQERWVEKRGALQESEPQAWDDPRAQALMQRLLGHKANFLRRGAFVEADHAGDAEVRMFGLVGGGFAGAADALRLANAMAALPSSVRRIAIFLDAESHSPAASDERLVLSEYMGNLAFQIRRRHRQGADVQLIVTGVAGGGIFAALAGSVSRVSMLPSARLKVLPDAAMAAINKTEDEESTLPERALATGAADDLFTTFMKDMPMQANANFYAILQNARKNDSDAICIETESGESYSFAEIDRMAARYANALVAMGCQADDRVAAQLEKSPQALALFLACLRAGLIYLPLNTAYQASELTHFLTDAEPRVFVCAESQLLAMREFATSLGVAHVEGMDPEGKGSFTAFADAYPEAFDTVHRDPEDIATIMYTSGTTGRSKGAMLNHRAVKFCAQGLADYWEFTSNDVLLHALPIFHVHGLFVSTCVALLSGARILFHRKFDADAVMRELPRSTVMMAVPTFYHRLLSDARFNPQVSAKMRLFTSGSAPLTSQVHDEFFERCGHKILERYGATETMILTSNPVHGERRAGSVGLPLPGVELRIAGEDDKPLPTGSIGMIQVRGAGLFSGYWRMPGKMDEDMTADGFFRTGDLGSQSADGYVTITGREKDMIISGGYNVYPVEIESVLDNHTAVAESAVIGIPHPDFGEAVTAVVIPRHNGTEVSGAELIAWVKSHLANYKVPKHVVLVEQLPRNALGKIQKNVLRATYAHLGKAA